jgi:predicted nucleic acid-binding protein
MPFVLDASIVLAWAFPDEQTAVADIALERLEGDPAEAPALWWFEVSNALIWNTRA